MLALSLLILCGEVAAPFNSWHELNDAVFAQLARNHIEWGLGRTLLYSTWGDTLAPPAVPDRYLNHPPLLAVWTAAALRLLGDHEWSARLVPIAATLGSTALLMHIVGRLGQPLLGALAGFFFATLPLTAYFGRMLCHEAPTQFFSLLMLNGYLAWAGDYATVGAPGLGLAVFAAGAVLGIGTGWAAVVAAGLLWAWHALRAWRGRGRAKLLVGLALVPGVTLAAVVLHIVAGAGWDVGSLRALLGARSVGGEGGQAAWSAWLAVQAAYFVRSFTWPGALAVLIAPALLLAARHRARQRDTPGPLAWAGPAKVATFCGLQGLLWLVGLKNQAWYHDYWQFFLAPAVALCLAGVTLAARSRVAPRWPRLGALTTVLLMALPMPFAAASRDFYARHRTVDPELIQALAEAGRRLPHRAPIWTSHRIPTTSETFGRYTHTWPQPIVEYYANRPLFFSRDAAEVARNAPACVAYLLKRSEQPWARELEASLSRSFQGEPVAEQHLLFRLDRPLGASPLPSTSAPDLPPAHR